MAQILLLVWGAVATICMCYMILTFPWPIVIGILLFILLLGSRVK